MEARWTIFVRMADFKEKEIKQAILIAEDENQLQPLTGNLPSVESIKFTLKLPSFRFTSLI